MKNPYLPLLKNMGEHIPPFYIFGGFAEDAMLFGKMSRPHDDVDLFVARKDVDTTAKWFQKQGFKEYAIYLHDPSGKPTVLHSEQGKLTIELCIYDTDDTGKHYFNIYGETDDDEWRIYLAEDAFDYKKSTLDGVSIQTISPLAQYMMRSSLGITNSFGGLREKDITSQKLLKEKFFSETEDEKLKPRVVKLKDL